MRINYKIIISILLISGFVFGFLFLPLTSMARTIQNDDGTVTTIDEPGDNNAVNNNPVNDNPVNDTGQNTNTNSTNNNTNTPVNDGATNNSDTSKSDTGSDAGSSVVLAPADAEITDVEVKVNYNPNGSKGFSLRIKTNMPVSPYSIFISMNLIVQHEYDLLKTGTDLIKIYNGIQGSAAVDFGKQESREFVFGVSEETSSEKKDVIGKIVMVGIYTKNGSKLTNPLLLLYNGTYEKLPIPPMQSVFTGSQYLFAKNICLNNIKDNSSENGKNNLLCNIVSTIMGDDQVPFDNILAEKYPLFYVLLLYLNRYLLFALIFILALSYIFLVILQRKPWGVVFDSKTLKPLEGAIVRIFDKEKNKLMETKVTDKNGRFSLLPGTGDFYIKVMKPGYNFPSHYLTHLHHPSYYHLYHGEEFLIRSSSAMFVTNIPLDPSHQAEIINKPSLGQRFVYSLAKNRWVFLGIFIALVLINTFLINIDFLKIAWINYLFIPIILFELYFLVFSKRIKILK